MNLVHGGDWAGFLAETGTMPLDFSANVSPLGLPAGVKRAIQGALDDADRYPDPLCRKLREGLGTFHSAPPEHILCGNGASDLIFRLALALRPRRALVTAPTFGEYRKALTLVGAVVEEVPLSKELDFDVTEGVLDNIRPGVDLLFLCSPNNPTGRVIPRPLLLNILSRCTECGTRLVVDECFMDLADSPVTMANQVAAHPNLIVLRAFTKQYALAGVRLGYCLCSDGALLESMEDSGPPWAVSSLAQAAGLAALEESAYLEQARQLIAAQRPMLLAGLRGLGLYVVPGEANYLLFCANQTDLCPQMRKMGILIRDCANYSGLGPGWYRVAVRTEEENSRLLAALKEVMEWQSGS